MEDQEESGQLLTFGQSCEFMMSSIFGSFLIILNIKCSFPLHLAENLENVENKQIL